MILITDGTSYLGHAVVRSLAMRGEEVCCMLQPSARELRLPAGLPLLAVSASLSDLPALCASLQGVSAVIHLLDEWHIAPHKSALDHPRDTANLVTAMQEAGVRRLVYVSRMGADSASAYPVLRIRGDAEAAVRRSTLAYTILQPALYYGPKDGFVSILAAAATRFPFALPVPDTGLSRLQVLWIEDLARCVQLSLGQENLVSRTVPFGGPEHTTLEQMAAQVVEALGVRRKVKSYRLPVFQLLSNVLGVLPLNNPCPLWLLDLLSAGCATDLNATAQAFGFEPQRFGAALASLLPGPAQRRDRAGAGMQPG
jgi:uncharacterized protein YbjT (DUF2867 family)